VSVAASDAIQLTQAPGLMSIVTEPSSPLFIFAATAAISTYAPASWSTTALRYAAYTGPASPVLLQAGIAFAALASPAAYL
jgi:hypothetical protein